MISFIFIFKNFVSKFTKQGFFKQRAVKPNTFFQFFITSTVFLLLSIFFIRMYEFR